MKYHFPDAEQYGDITKADFSKWRDRIDVLTGGFPCQPFSLAGKRKGTEDARYLWPSMLGVIRAVRPRWVVGENVYGLVNWSDGLVLDTVCSDLEAAGYEVGTYVIPACGVGAPHRRDRIWIVAHGADARAEDKRRGTEPAATDRDAAYADSHRRRIGEDKQEPFAECEREAHAGVGGEENAASDPESKRFPERNDEQVRNEAHPAVERHDSIPNWENFPTQSPVCNRNDGFPGELAGLSFPAWRRESVKALGNAIVPQVVLRIFETIDKYEKK